MKVRKRRMRNLNLFILMVVAYIVATIFYVFVNEDGDGWTLYYNSVLTLLVLTLFVGFTKQHKSEMDKSLLVALVLLRVFNLCTNAIWYFIGSNWQSTPTCFCIMVVVCLLLGLMLNKNILWKPSTS